MTLIIDQYRPLNLAGRNRDQIKSGSCVRGSRLKRYLRLLPIVTLSPILFAQTVDGGREALGVSGTSRRCCCIVARTAFVPATILQLPGFLGQKQTGVSVSGDHRFRELGGTVGGAFGFVIGLIFCLLVITCRLTAISCTFSDSQTLFNKITSVARRWGFGKMSATERHWEFRASSLSAKYRGSPGVKVEFTGDRAYIVGPYFLIEELKRTLPGATAATYSGPYPWVGLGKALLKVVALFCGFLILAVGAFAWFVTHH